ncbi:hypothetical protein [Streptomyces flavofungini]|uniref:Inorganic polyphosphate kinase n=1 Tax=Streptomyces flavofungini TaxID=68200 RepID=A0ABS0X1Q5_9ACTN|nr:hypothetical protein [Streptomyces flavofungini]MBJ3807123.1 hypothetical protein [Streptomyces flavofungini]GHC74871.1 hypothetical protein GCM10010349_53640 [Streptomyces flavofungini]
MTLAPRAVLVHRTTEYEELLARHGTHGQAAFFLSSRGRDIDEVAGRHRLAQRALADVAAAVPLRWRTARVERADLDRFLFGPEDVVVVVGQDGLVANAAKYLSGQPVVGVDAEPGRNPGVLVRHRAADAAKLLPHAAAGAAGADELTMVEAVTDDGQRLRALNEIYVGAAGHQTARYRLSSGAGPGGTEAQASSGVVVGTGTGATGWLGSLRRQAADGPRPPEPYEARLLWFVREAWPSPTTGTTLVRGELTAGQRLWLTVESDHLVAFGDGMETDALGLGWGQSVRVGVAAGALRLVG